MTANENATPETVVDDRRKYSRVRFPKVRVQAPGPEGWQDEFLQDLSPGGVFLVSPRTLPVGGEVDLRLLIPESDSPLDITALVTRIEQGSRDADSGMAVEFVEITDEQRSRLESLVEHFASEPMVTIFDDETGEPRPTAAERLMQEVDDLGRQWAIAKGEVGSARTAMVEREQALLRSQERLESTMRRVQAALHELPHVAVAHPIDPSPHEVAPPQEEAQHEQEREALVEQLRSDLEAERERSRDLERRVDELQTTVGSLQTPEAGRDARIQMLTAELLQMKEQAHRHEAEAAEARLALAELRSSSELTAGDHLPPPTPASLRGARDEVGEFEVEFAIEGEEDAETAASPELEEVPPAAPEETGAEAPESPEMDAPHPEPLQAEPSAEAAAEDDSEQASSAEASFADLAVEVEGVDQAQAEAEPEEEAGGARLVSHDEQTVGPETLDSLDSFEAALRGGAQIRRTPRFERLEPVSRGDIQVSDWLREYDRLTPEGPGPSGMGEEQLVRVLHVFFQRELIRLTH